MRTLVAGVDSSTQSCKVVVCDAATGEVVREGRAAHPDGTEVDPRHWWDAFEQATAGGLLQDVQALSVGGQQHGLCALDDAGEVVRPALLWNDTRSAGDAADLVAELGGAQAWAQATGVVPLAAITVSKLRWLARHEPEQLGRTRTVVLPHDWLTGQILARHGGPAGWTTDRGDASGTGYWSAADGDYQPDLLELATGRRDLEVPRVLGPAEPAGTATNQALLGAGTLVGAGTGDNMAAALGLGLEPGEAVISLGTSGTAFARHTGPTQDALGEVASYADATGGFLPLLCTLNAARVLSAGARMLGVDLEGLEQLALAAPAGSGGLTLLPYLDGERTPNLPTATGTLSGMTRANLTPENLARAVVEGMLLNVVAGVDSLRREGVAVERVHLIGGAARSGAVRAVAPALLGVPVTVPEPGEYVALGAARQAAWALTGELPDWPVEVTELPAGAQDPQVGELRARYAGLLATMHG
ncbi:xylulokinase [Ornithinimicrobium avium]|uniref:Xylulose kinase n=1 Tax=Ornithinimicrobium avium TaxID=2283195 RepID=A0A345NIS9_9MICO|nr:xylulokinase [Ornithinimicrobium avium]AXH94937.1 xylulokinase [Ornithinimicrobium avium]